jgi:RNA polymerase sigma-70 factor (ECF subfamily)
MTNRDQCDEQRFISIVQTQEPALLAYITRLVDGDIARAEDITQETFVRAWRQIDRLTPEYGSVNGWLHRVAHNLTMDGYRRRQARPTEVALEHPDIAVRNDYSDNVLTSGAVDQMLNAMWPEHRAILVEVYLNDRTLAEAAVILGIPVGTAKSRLFYALRRLRNSTSESSVLAS